MTIIFSNFRQGDRVLEAANMNNDWPAGRAVFVNESKELLIWVNEEDHLRIISMQRGPSIHQVFQRLCDAVQHIEEHA